MKTKLLYYDCFCGISGDMHLGALLDLGVDSGYLIRELSGLKIDDEFEIAAARTQKNGITGTKADVILKNRNPEHHTHRHLQDIRAIIEGSALSGAVKQSSMRMFEKIAEAEGKVHGVPKEEVHFHEVGAVDSIVDIVGAAILLDALKPDRILSSPVQVGGGYVECAHGLIPVPAPATVEILTGIPVKSGLVPFETATPTGAAILACNAEEFTERMDFTVRKIGYGFGTRELKVPNAEQHLQLRIRAFLTQSAQALPRILVQEAEAGIIRCAAPALQRIEADLIQFFQNRKHVRKRHAGRKQRLVRVAQNQFGNANFLTVC